MLVSLVYTSRAVQPMEQADLLALVHQARARNSETGLSGLLFYRDGTFLQVIEGEQEPVEALFASIEGDSRHRDVTLVWSQPLPARQFPSWSLGFSNLGDGTTDVEGWDDAQDGPDPTATDADFVRELLDIFDAQR